MIREVNEHISLNENLLSNFSVKFEEIFNNQFPQVCVSINGLQVGDVIDDNAYLNDGYRYHDIFHYTFATMLGWSPCMRAMLKCKRKSNSEVDRVEDGARAAITEEAISLMLFNEAKKKDFFQNEEEIDDTILSILKSMTSTFEVATKSKDEWSNAILVGYSMFRSLFENKGGFIYCDTINQQMSFSKLN